MAVPVKAPLRDVQEEAPAALCERCGGEVWRGERRFQWEGKWLCPDCFRFAVERMLRNYPESLAYELGLEVERYE